MSGESIVGGISDKEIRIADANPAPMPEIAPPGVIVNGEPVAGFETIDASSTLPDVRSFRRKLGLLLPATNTSMEHELWTLLCTTEGLEGIGMHTANVMTPKPQLRTAEDLLEYKRQFLAGLTAAVDQVLLAGPQYLIMGMSLEHILVGLEEVRAPMLEVERHAGMSMATCHDAISAALERLGATRIGLLTPFDRRGNENATQMYVDLGVEVVATAGLSCANTLHIAHLPDWAKEKAIVEHLATAENRLDAIVQVGTNMSLCQVSEKLEPELGVPVLGINAVLLWYALRENGFTAPIARAGMLLRDH